MNPSNALQMSKQLIAGRVEYDDLCRYAAHNLAERTKVREAMNVRGVSKPRMSYLKSQMKCLMIEKSLLETKESRIKPFVSSSHNFVI